MKSSLFVTIGLLNLAIGRQKLTLGLILLFLLIVPDTSAQKIVNVNFEVKENKMHINYDLQNCPLQQKYDISCKIWCDGKIIQPSSITGDLTRISCGPNKKIEWDVLTDLDALKGQVQVEVNIVKTYDMKVTGGPSNAFLSMLLPGLGDRYVNKDSKRWYYISLAYLGSAYLAYSAKQQSNSYYDQYHQASSQADMDAAYDAANSKFQNYQLFVGAAASIWVADVIYVTYRGFKNRKQQLQGLSGVSTKTMFYCLGTPNALQFGLLRKF